jgi:phage baseplate assembly protein W
MAIRLDIVKPTTAVETARKAGYLYKDILFDLKTSYGVRGGELLRSNSVKDLEAIYDVDAVIVSLKNIMTTTPGEKLLNPTFGLDLRDYLFETVSETKAFFLAQKILTGLSVQEPRVVIEYIDIVALIDEMEYDIELNLSVPSLNVYGLSLKTALNNEGYLFT